MRLYNIFIISLIVLWQTIPIAFGELHNVTMMGPTEDYILVVDVPNNLSLEDLRPTEFEGITTDSVCISRYGNCNYDGIIISTSIMPKGIRPAIALEKIMSQIEKEMRIDYLDPVSNPWKISNHTAKVYRNRSFSAAGALLGTLYYGGYAHNETIIATFRSDLSEVDTRNILNRTYLI